MATDLERLTLEAIKYEEGNSMRSINNKRDDAACACSFKCDHVAANNTHIFPE